MLSATRLIGHKEWTKRKSDPRHDMNWRRDRVATFQPKGPEKEDDMPRFDLIRNKDTGEVVLAAAGVWFRVPEPPYITLYADRGLIKSRTPDLDIPANEFGHFRDVYLSAVLDAPIARSEEAGGGTTSLRAQAHWDDHNFRTVTPEKVADLVASPDVDADTLAAAFARPEVAEAFAAAMDRRARDGDPATGPVS